MPRAVRWVGTAVAVLAGIWMGGAQGVALQAWAAVATALVTAALVACRTAIGGVAVDAPRLWLAGVVVWTAVAGAVLPVGRSEAGYLAAVGLVALGLAGSTTDWRSRAWAAGAVAALGAVSGVGLVAGRWVLGVRSDGLLGNPNLSATVALLGLATVPFVRVPAALRLVGGTCSLAGIAASGSRAAMLGAGAVTLAWFLGGVRRRWMRRVALAVLLLAATGLVVRVGTDRDPLRFERLRIWGVAAGVARAAWPWGTGPSGFADAALARNFPRTDGLARYGRLPSLAESDVLQLVTSLGVPGALLGAGLLWSLWRRLRGSGPHAWGCAAAVLVTSALHSQLPVPVVAWTATLALAAALPPGRRWRLPASTPTRLAVASVAGGVLAVALVQPPWWLGGTAASLLAAARAVAVAPPRHEVRVADAEALAWRAAVQRPRWGEAWRTLGELRTMRGLLRRDAELLVAARAALAQARAANPLDAFAALADGRAARAARDLPASRAALQAAVSLEPNLAAAWLELAELAIEEGRLGASRLAMEQVRRVATLRVDQPSDYERALLATDPAALWRVEAATRGGG